MALDVHLPHTVYTRTYWGDTWTAVPYLYCNSCTFAVAPSVNSAVLEWDYGRMMQHGSAAFVNYPKINLVNRYVKVAITNGPTWYGICIDDDDNRDGESLHGGNAILTGKQNPKCRGLEYLLQRDPITTSIVKDSNAAGGEKTIGRAIGFNLGAGLPGSAFREPNAAKVAGQKNTAIFTDDLMQVTPWKANMILAYLIEYLFPRNSGGFENIGWTYDENVIRQYLASHKPTLQIHGKTAWQVLNELIDRRRLLGWTIAVDPFVEVPEIQVFSFNSSNVMLPPQVGGDPGDPFQIVRNAGQYVWNFDRENLVQTCTLSTDNSAKFDKVVVRGEAPGSVFTAEMSGGGGNNLLEIDWTTDQQTKYRRGAAKDDADADVAAYTAMDSTQKANANQTARTKDALKKVFSYWRLNYTTFTGTISGKPVWPLDSGGNKNTPLSFWLPGIRLRDYLPLRLEHNYETVAAITNDVKEKSKWEYQRPFAFIQDANGKYYFLDRTGRGEEVDTHLASSGRYWAASLRMQDDAPGFVLTVSGAPQHIIAKTVFTAIDADDEIYEPDADYNYLGLTVFAEGDGNVTAEYPANPIGGDTLKTLNITAPNCRLDYLVPGTTIDIAADGTRIQSTGGFIQDDTTYMKNIARSAYEWYGQSRRSMQVVVHDLGYLTLNNATPGGPGLPEVVGLGSLILSIGSANPQDINSVVTSIEYDMIAGTSTYTTQFGELDL